MQKLVNGMSRIREQVFGRAEDGGPGRMSVAILRAAKPGESWRFEVTKVGLGLDLKGKPLSSYVVRYLAAPTGDDDEH